ncbi:2171_t:CDS:2 [Rhizophagus irregularis]|nr:2171_t:CDS:2 [Rhizophagus irregularis]
MSSAFTNSKLEVFSSPLICILPFRLHLLVYLQLVCDAVIVSILRSSSSNNVFDIFILCIPEWVHFGVATREKPVESDILTILMGLTKDGVLTTTNPQ